jgi:organic radical activating enzyme
MRIEFVLRRLGLGFTSEEQGFYVHRSTGQALRALSLARPSKASLVVGSLGRHPHASRTIETVVPTGNLEEVVTLSTTLGSFVAGGFVVKNCDTKYTWDWDNYDRAAETDEIAVDDVVSRIADLAGNHTRNVVITGGEPLLQQDAVITLVGDLRRRGLRTEVETNGTIEPRPELAALIDQWNVSPKLENSGNKKTARLRVGPLSWFADSPSAFFKFVVASDSDLAEVDALRGQFGIPTEHILVMPEGTDAQTLQERARWLAEEARVRGYRFGTRLHVLLWGSERGR